MASAGWTDDELDAAVQAYADMMDRSRLGQKFNKAAIYRDLASRFGRVPEAYERRMMNISAVLSANGKEFLPGLVPAANVGAGVFPRIEQALVRAGIIKSGVGAPASPNMRPTGPAKAWPMPFPAEGQRRANLRALTGVVTSEKLAQESPPAGVLKPRVIAPTTKTYARDEAVKAWVLRRAKGRCECCKGPAPFTDISGAAFLEVHHLRQLAHEGTDRHTNAVALCPNCHRALHLGRDAAALRTKLYESVSELVPE